MPDPLHQRMAAAGLGPDDPLTALIEEVARAAERASLGPGEVDRIAQRLAEASVGRIEAGLWRRLRLLEIRTLTGAAVVLALGLGLAFWAGWSVRAAQPVQTAIGPLSPRAVTVLRINDLDAALDRCASTTQSAGGRACAVPLWIEAPPVRR